MPGDRFKDPEERLRIAKHEMAHAIIAYALKSKAIFVQLYDRPQRVKAWTGRWLYAAGVCRTVYRHHHHMVFVTCGPFACPVYAVDEWDETEFNDMVRTFVRISGKSPASFRSCVLDPVRDLLDSKPATEIINRLAVPIAKGGRLNCRSYKDMEQFFPNTFSRPLLEALCRNIQEAADDMPRTRTV